MARRRQSIDITQGDHGYVGPITQIFSAEYRPYWTMVGSELGLVLAIFAGLSIFEWTGSIDGIEESTRLIITAIGFLATLLAAGFRLILITMVLALAAYLASYAYKAGPWVAANIFEEPQNGGTIALAMAFLTFCVTSFVYLAWMDW